MNIDDLDAYISVNRQGQIVVESIVKRDFIGNYDVMMSCVEDNIVPCVVREGIDWNGVRQDYKAAMEMPVNKG